MTAMKARINRRWIVIVLSLVAFCVFCAAALFAIVAPYSVNGQRMFSYASDHVGGLVVIDGRLPKEELRQQIADGTYANTNRHNWFYLMIICRDVKAAANQGSGSGINHDLMSYPRFHYEWATDKGTARVSLRWNMWTDNVSIGGQKFNRKKGNVFVVVRESNGELMTRQCGTLSSQADRPEIVRHIRQRLPDDELVKSLRYHRRNTN